MEEFNLGTGATQNVIIGTAYSLPIAYYIKKIMIIVQNEAALAKAMWFQWGVIDPEALSSTLLDVQWMASSGAGAGFDLTSLAIPGVGVGSAFSIHRAINHNNNQQVFYYDSADGNTLIIEQYANIRIPEHNDPGLYLRFFSFDGGNFTSGALDFHVVMECVVA